MRFIKKSKRPKNRWVINVIIKTTVTFYTWKEMKDLFTDLIQISTQASISHSDTTTSVRTLILMTASKVVEPAQLHRFYKMLKGGRI